MPVKFRKKGGGYSGSPNSKIVQVNARQGDPNIGSQQATSRAIYDAVPLVANASNGSVTLFENCRNRAFPLTNITENKLQKGESLVMQRFSFFILECTAGTTNLVAAVPLGYFSQFQNLYGSTFNFQVGQTVIFKNFPLLKMFGPFNPDSNFMGMYQFQTFAAGAPTSSFLSNVYSHDVFNFDADTVLPVDVEFKVDVKIPPVSLPAGFDYFLGMSISGLGSLYAPKGNF